MAVMAEKKHGGQRAQAQKVQGTFPIHTLRLLQQCPHATLVHHSKLSRLLHNYKKY